MKRSVLKALLLSGVLAGMVGAEEFSQTPKRETLAEAVRFEKYKIAAAEAQARKDAGESASIARKARKQGQADTTKQRRADTTKSEKQPAPVK